jgi:hypothetical protein
VNFFEPSLPVILNEVNNANEAKELGQLPVREAGTDLWSPRSAPLFAAIQNPGPFARQPRARVTDGRSRECGEAVKVSATR